jgi:hypothetical protein
MIPVNTRTRMHATDISRRQTRVVIVEEAAVGETEAEAPPTPALRHAIDISRRQTRGCRSRAMGRSSGAIPCNSRFRIR